MKKRLSLIFISLAFIFLFTGCEKKDSNVEFKVGIIQLVEHKALTSARQGFIDGLAESGYVEGQNIAVDYNNAQGEQANCVTIAQKLINNKNDIILAIATPAAQAVANLTKSIPVVITAVTDPASAKLVASNEVPGGNVTGTSDLTPVKAQIELIKKIIPQIQTVGLLYSSSEQNSKFQIEIAKQTCDSLGIKYLEGSVTSSNDIQQVAESLIKKVDAIYVPTDNTVASAMATVTLVANEDKKPIFCGEEALLEQGALATYGIDYYQLGKQTATQAISILRGEKKPAEMPIEYQKNLKFSVNMEVAKLLGIEIPEDLINFE